MSDQTRAALDDAIRAHLADEDPDGGMVAHWALAVGLISSDDDESPMWFDSPTRAGAIRHYRTAPTRAPHQQRGGPR
ncbi:hypothetical protein [Sanguibacter sp. Z1732]|uniref:hypothetical protein n=1 Tax=Sanguibacter sp. Z1732 TaxID=3435412 RepID=UPI003D9C8D7D